MVEPASLTRSEAQERAALIDVRRYDIAVDLTGMLEGPDLRAVSTTTFGCTEPGASTFVDVVADVVRATLNDVPLDPASVEAGRLPLSDLQAENVLVVETVQPDTGSAAGVLRTVDPSDKLVYVWTSFEPDAARRVWACFDQPDLKAPHAFTVTAPESWTVTSCTAPDRVEDADVEVAPAARVWHFPDTPPLSTYVVVVNAGPFVELRREHAGHDLGLYARQSLARYLERDADELFDLTARGLDWFGERFGLPFPQRRYDQVFVPNMGGAMENWGCVTWTDAVLFRSTPSYAQRAMRANVLLHEMAHMWFGDMVTMLWWDDLWLNEAFASWAATWSSAGATEHVDAWAGTLVQTKLEGYRADMGPGTHPIRADVPDVAQAMANFDAITYSKGESVLKQLSAYVGEDAFVAGLQSYFRDHQWGSTTLDDLISAIGAASGRDLDAWTTAWLDRAGTDTIRLDLDAGGAVLTAESPDDLPPRPHRLDVLSLAAGADGLDVVATTAVETSGTRTEVDLPAADVHLLNAGDLTFAAVRTDAGSVRLLTERAGHLPDPLSRAVAGTTAWDMLVKGEVAASGVVGTLTGALAAERSPLVVEAFLALSLRATEQWAPREQVGALLEQVAGTAAGLVDQPELRTAALRTLAASARSADHLALLASAAQDDLDLGWRVLARRSELGDLDDDAVRALEEADPDPEAWVRALGVRAAHPDAERKQEAWTALVDELRVPMGQPLIQVGQLFWRPGQADLLQPFAHRYLDVLPDLATGGLLMAGAMIRLLFPYAVADQEFLARAEDVAHAPGAHPAVRQNLLTGTDTLRRMLAARAA